MKSHFLIWGGFQKEFFEIVGTSFEDSLAKVK